MQVIKTVSKTDKEEITQEFTVFSPVVYDKLKWFVQIVLPAFSALYLALAGLWNLPAAQQVVGTIAAVTAFLGICLGISASRYKNSDAPYDGKMVVATDGGGVAGFSLELDGDPEQLADKKNVNFKVSQVPTPPPQ